MKQNLFQPMIFFSLLVTFSSCRDKNKIDTQNPTLGDVTASEIQEFSAKVASSVLRSGSSPITDYGFAISKTAEEPEVDNASTRKGAIDPTTPTPIPFSADLSKLEPNTEYYVRAFATTANGTTYSKTARFSTAETRMPVIRTEGAENITQTSATLKANLTSKGTYAITEYGVVWGTATDPTTALATKSSTKGNVTDFPRSITANAASLTPNTTYNYRGYVISNGVTTYGENKTFKTLVLVQPTVITGDVKSSERVATAFGTISAKGSQPISEYGICWGTSANPTTANSRKSYSGDVTSVPKEFDVEMENLNPGTRYHYRAYVIMAGTTTYGENKSFETRVSAPTVITGEAFTIVGRGTVLTGEVRSQGSFPITEIGFVYGTDPNPTTAHSKVSTTGAGKSFPYEYNFTVNLPGSGAVYFRAYAIANGQTHYGSSKIARSVPPSLTVGSWSTSSSSYILNGTINLGGTYPIREYGIVWVTGTGVPTVSNNKLAITGNPSSFPVNFTRSISHSSIGNCVTVSYRAYAITTDGAVYYSSGTQRFTSVNCVK